MADVKILVVYTSWSGNTEALARAIVEGAADAGNKNVEVEMKRARDVGQQDIEGASALAFGSPTYYSYMSGEMKTLFDNALPFKEAFYHKPVVAFATGQGGQLKCIQSIEAILELFGVVFIQKSDILSAGLAVQGRPNEDALRQAKAVGRKLGDAGVEYVCELRSKNIIVGQRF